ncbi:MAG: AMMECR1 family protein, partial [Eubacteriales bacterium]|nr:AMMECR1 family protein [Eubacteriales bacterium]
PTTESIAAEVIQNSVSAGMNDPRFPSVRKNELKDLSYSVDVLCSAEPIDSPSMLDPRRYGVIVKSGLKRGLLLPDLEGIDTAEEQIKIACSKAGIDPGEDISLERFEVVRYK